MSVRQAGVTRRVLSVKIMEDDVLRTAAIFTPPMTAFATPATVSGQGFTGALANITSASSRATPVGGQGPYTYLWEPTEGSGGVSSPALAQTTFWATVPAGSSVVRSYRCTITDALGKTAQTNIVTATFINN